MRSAGPLRPTASRLAAAGWVGLWAAAARPPAPIPWCHPQQQSCNGVLGRTQGHLLSCVRAAGIAPVPAQHPQRAAGQHLAPLPLRVYSLLPELGRPKGGGVAVFQLCSCS